MIGNNGAEMRQPMGSLIKATLLMKAKAKVLRW